MLYETIQEREYAYLSLNRVKVDLQYLTLETSASNTPAPAFTKKNTDEKLAQNIATRFKSSEKHTGKLGEETNELTENHLDAAIEYGLEMLKNFGFSTTLLMEKHKVCTGSMSWEYVRLLQKRV